MPRQHCTTHTLATVLEQVPTGVQAELRALALVHAVLQEAQAGSQRLVMSPAVQCLLATMRVPQQATAA